jgi:alpha-mannosidase
MTRSLQKLESCLFILKRAQIIERVDLAPWKLYPMPSAGEKMPVVYDDEALTIAPSPLLFEEERVPFLLYSAFTAPKQPGNGAVYRFFIDLGKSKALEALDFLYGPEALLFIDGVPYHGVDPNHQEIDLPDTLIEGQVYTIMVRGWSGIRKELYRVSLPQIVRIDLIAQRLCRMMSTLIGIVKNLPEEASQRIRLLDILEKVYSRLDFTGEGTVRGDLESLLQEIEQSIACLPGKSIVDIAAVGHAHLDLAWLWDIDRAKQKGAQTFTNVLRLFDEDPEFLFSCSQPQLYQFIKETYPEIFARIAQRVKEGRWELIGGMWVEADCNITGAESLARQFLLGRLAYRELFDHDDTPVLWLPDVFGFCWQLPQLATQAGMIGFATAKLSWNQDNRMPHDTFWWKGLDGTSILTSLITTRRPGWWGATYSGEMSPDEIFSTWKNRSDKHLTTPILMPYGLGDGGGGPTREMLERSKILGSVPGIPQVTYSSVQTYFERLYEVAHNRTFPIWDGELYLELHRGTYTTQGRTKRANRLSERLLHLAEFVASWAHLSNSEYRYPSEDFLALWRAVALHQFHDILPGSSIRDVYDQAQREYEIIEQKAMAICETAVSSVLSPASPLTVVNPAAFDSPAYIEIPDERFKEYEGCFNGLPTQKTGESRLIYMGTVPSYGMIQMYAEGNISSVEDMTPVVVSYEGTDVLLGNRFMRLRLNQSGEVVELFDRETGRECLQEGERGNVFEYFEDRPLDWDAWDIEEYYDQKPLEVERISQIEILERGPLRGMIQVSQKIGHSHVIQRISITHESRRIDFTTHVDWQETHTLWKVYFPTSIHAKEVTCDTQWGSVKRPTHKNTSWDSTRFEFCAHMWIDVSEYGYGVSLLNDCKYGHSAQGGSLALTLLRSPTFPDDQADRGAHDFTYSLLPHKGDWRDTTVPEAYGLNYPCFIHTKSVPLKPARGGSSFGRVQCIRVSSNQVIIETIKQAEDSCGIIVRMYEYTQATIPDVTLHLDVPIREAWVTNLLEEPLERLPVDQNSCQFSVKPYQIITLRLLL